MSDKLLPELKIAETYVAEQEPKVNENLEATKQDAAPECPEGQDVPMSLLDKEFSKAVQYGNRSARKYFYETCVCPETIKLRRTDSEINEMKKNLEPESEGTKRDWATIFNEEKIRYRAGMKGLSADPKNEYTLLQSFTDRPKLIYPERRQGYTTANGLNGLQREKFGA